MVIFHSYVTVCVCVCVNIWNSKILSFRQAVCHFKTSAGCLAAWLTSLTRRFMDTIVLHKDFCCGQKKKCLKFGGSEMKVEYPINPAKKTIPNMDNMVPQLVNHTRFLSGRKIPGLYIPHVFFEGHPQVMWLLHGICHSHRPARFQVNWVKPSQQVHIPRKPWNSGRCFIRIHPKSPWMGPSSDVNVGWWAPIQI